MPSFPFLTHVAGLRGIAIILIILFHFTQGNSQYDIFEFKNGFLGVEIFMVLMGYFLILGLLKKREITFIKFITQKISRLLFPLAVTIIFCALIGIAILDFSYLAVMGRTGRSALLGFSNFKLIYDSTNYFSPDASMNCMLHTWYISAALQLFILSYIFFWITKKWNKAWIIISLFFVGMLSLSIHFNVGENCLTKLGIPDTYHTYITSYYSPLPRIWEFISGGLILLLPDVRITKWKNILFTSGILLILLAWQI